MVKIALLLIGIFLLADPIRAESDSAGVAANVNGEAISRAEVDRQVKDWLDHQDPDLLRPELEARTREIKIEKLNTLIDRVLAIQAFYREGDKVPDDYVDGQLNDIVKNEYGGDRSAFDRTLIERKVPLEKYRQEIADNYIVGQMHSRFGWHPVLFPAQECRYQDL